ncbi:hypothetical protein D3C80_1404610 [compost metagenome]
MLITLKLGQHLAQRLAVEDQFTALPGSQRPGVRSGLQPALTQLSLAFGNDHAVMAAITTHTEHRPTPLHRFATGLDDKGTRVAGRLEQCLAGLEHQPSLAIAEIHRQGTATVEQYLRAVGQGNTLLLTNAGVVVGEQGRCLLPATITNQRQHQ